MPTYLKIENPGVFREFVSNAIDVRPRISQTWESRVTMCSGDAQKRRAWETRFARYRAGGLSVARFCGQERRVGEHLLLLGETTENGLGHGVVAGRPDDSASARFGRANDHSARWARTSTGATLASALKYKGMGPQEP